MGRIGSEAAHVRRFLVRGRVQGVGFRVWARAEARRLNLDGFVRNLPDGSVEVIAAGEPSSADLLAERLRSGPPGAHVESVEESTAEEQTIQTGFRILH